MDIFGLSNVINLIDKVGVVQGIFIIILVSVIYIFTKHWVKRIDINYESIKTDNNKLNEEIKNLKMDHQSQINAIEAEIKKKIDQRTNFMKNHPFFSTMDYLMDVKIPGINFKSHFKRIVFVDILTYMVRGSQEVFRDFVMDESNYQVGGLEFRNNVTKAMKNCHQKFISSCDSSVVPREVMESFNLWASPLTRFLFSATESICDSKMYETNIDKINTILSINLAIYDEMVSNIELYLDEMNGDFVGLVYKGITCEEEHHHI